MTKHCLCTPCDLASCMEATGLGLDPMKIPRLNKENEDLPKIWQQPMREALLSSP